MPFDNPLLPIWSRYQAARAGLTVAIQTLADPHDYWRRTIRAGSLPTADDLRLAREQLNDWVIVELWAGFERRLVEYLARMTTLVGKVEPPELHDALHRELRRAIDRWPIDTKIKLFEWLIGPGSVGQVIQIKDYRDWLAHNNPEKQPKGRTAPEYVNSILGLVLRSIHDAI